MGLTWRKRIRVGPFASLNLSKRGISTSMRVGPLTVNSRGRVSTRLGKGVAHRGRWR